METTIPLIAESNDIDEDLEISDAELAQEDTVEDTSDLDIILSDKFKKRFSKKYRQNKSGCWIWQAKRDPDGYGHIRVGKRIKRAHRISYMMATGAVIPFDEHGNVMDIDHLCHMRACVNPDHLEMVPHKENMQRLRKVNDWISSNDEFRKKITSAEEALNEALSIMERSKVERPKLLGIGKDKGYSVNNKEGAPWRDMVIEGGYIAQDPDAIIALYLLAVSQGADWRIAADKILGVSPYTVVSWRRHPEFNVDLVSAKKMGRHSKYQNLEDLHIDELERKIEYADFKDVASSLRALRENDPERIAMKQKQEASAQRHISIVFGSDASEKLLRTILEQGEALEAEYEEVV